MTEPHVSHAAESGFQKLHPKLVDPETAPRPRIKELEVMVAEVIRETPDTATLVLFTGNDRLEYQPGHFLTIRPQQFPALDRFCKYFEDMKGRKEPARAYSLVSAPHERHLAITVKEERYVSGLTKFPPLLSPLLVWRLSPGTRMVVTGFGGPYVLPNDCESRTDHIVHICAGSGSVPNFSILKHCLAQDMKIRHTMIYGNKTWDDVIFRRHLDEICRQYPDKVRVVHALSREPDLQESPHVRGGRVNEALIREFISDPTAVEVFACGPGITKFDKQAAREKGEEPQPRFLESVLDALEALGVPDERIHRESYG
ncbi:MAG TPA: oxidoreductase [Thermoanaerobaculia bacterium]|jgi:ferredoxin-NADP reductase|nr:oxidoreductase [Thermoanaerobaculia bacterium]